jgi:hypothetical protein
MAAGFVPPYWFDPTNASLVQQYSTCFAELSEQVGTNAVFFSSHYVALDFVTLMGLLRDEGTTAISLYCLSYGTYLCNMILLHYQLGTLTKYQTPPDAVVLDGPAPANRWRLEDTSTWYGVAADNNLNACIKYSAACLQHLGLWAHIPRLVMESIIDGTLPCFAKLPWLSQHVVANMNADFQLGGSSGSYILAGPFWKRLYVCSDSDADQLTFYYNKKMKDWSCVFFSLFVDVSRG